MTTPKPEKKNFDELVANLKPIENELVQRGTTFFGGKYKIELYFYLCVKKNY